MQLELDARGRRYLDRFRKLALALPEVVETEAFGHPWFKVGGAKGKLLSVFGRNEDRWSLCFKCGKANMGVFLNDPRFVRTPYLGHQGWVTLLLDPAKPDWDEVAGLLSMSYRNNSPARLRSKV